MGKRSTDNIDRMVHEPARLCILSLLSGVNEADFASVQRTLELTHGNLSIHIARLEAVGYVEVRKSIVGKAPRTSYRLTDAGRKALDKYWKSLAEIRSLAKVWAQPEVIFGKD